jgi:hypothetical protein
VQHKKDQSGSTITAHVMTITNLSTACCYSVTENTDLLSIIPGKHFQSIQLNVYDCTPNHDETY